MPSYLSNIHEAYRPSHISLNETLESFKKFPQAQMISPNTPDATRVKCFALKVLALPFLLNSASIIGKIAYNKRFSYRSFALAGATFIPGHDLANGAENDRKRRLESKTIAPFAKS